MNGSEESSSYSGEEIFMILLLAVLIPIMLLAANLDLRFHVEQALRGFSDASSIRIWLANSDIKGTELAGETLAPSVALQENAAASAKAVIDPEIAVGTPNKSEVNVTKSLSLMALDFSLSELPSSRTRLPDPGGPLKVKKPVYAGTRLIGNMEITIVGEGELLLDANEVRAIMGQQAGASSNAPARLPDQGPVSFATLRELGIDLRYSPTDDVIRINP